MRAPHAAAGRAPASIELGTVAARPPPGFPPPPPMRYLARVSFRLPLVASVAVLAACASPASESVPEGDSDSDTDSAVDSDTAALGDPEFEIALNPDNPFAALATITSPRAASVYIEYGVDGGFDHTTPTTTIGAATPTRLQVMGLEAGREWSFRAVVDPVGDPWTSDPLRLTTEPLPAEWPACTTTFSADPAEYTDDEVFCTDLELESSGYRYVCWDRWGTPRHALRTAANTELSSARPLPEGGWATTGNSAAAITFLDNFGATVRTLAVSDLDGARFVHQWIDGHELLPITSGPWAGAVATLTVALEPLDVDRSVRGNGLVVVDPEDGTLLYDYSFHGLSGDGVPGSPLLDYARTRDVDTEDWLHANALAYGQDPDGRAYFLVSLRNQDWIVKLYPDTDELAWRLGREGDLQLVDDVDAAAPVVQPAERWLVHQHGLELLEAADGRAHVLLYDNGFPQRYDDAGDALLGYGRAAELIVDEATMRVSIPFQYGESLEREERLVSRNRGNAVLVGDDRVLFLLGDPRQVWEVGYPDGGARWSASFPESEKVMNRVRWYASLYDTGWTEDGPPSGPEAWLVHRDGHATIGDVFVGTESWRVTTDRGLGEVTCELTYPLASVAVRDDCAACDWAFDVELGAATVGLTDDCALAGIDPTAPTEGTLRGYGLATDYLGHAHTLLVDDGGGWLPVAFVEWDPGTGQVDYRWELDVVE